jgi:UDP-N-acetylglucosamine/UDP-N-acetylgalactosamine diphosphorylase
MEAVKSVLHKLHIGDDEVSCSKLLRPPTHSHLRQPGSLVRVDFTSLEAKANHDFGKKKEGAVRKEPTKQQVEELKAAYEKANQAQVWAFYDTLTVPDKAKLYEQLASFDPEHINTISQRALNPPKEDGKEPELEPLPDSATASVLDSKEEDIEKWYQSGLDLIADNKVGVVLMAGGQGTRLGSSDPKGCFNIGLPSEKSLFKIQAERIRKVQRLVSQDKHAHIIVTFLLSQW